MSCMRRQKKTFLHIQYGVNDLNAFLGMLLGRLFLIELILFWVKCENCLLNSIK